MAPSIYEKLEIPRWDRFTATKKEDGEFIYNFLHNKKINSTLEVGLAYAASSVYILSATKKTHYAMDPYQNTRYKNIGLKNIKRLKLNTHLVFYNDYSYNVLPKLLKEGVHVDFAFIDGSHLFDDIFLDFYYADKMLNSGGYVLFDDLWMRATSMTVAWIKKNKSNYHQITIPMKSKVLFQKKGDDKREWYHFKEFYTFKSVISQMQFNSTHKPE